MQTPGIEAIPTTPIVPSPTVDEEVFLLETLKTLLDGAICSLGGGNAQSLLEMSRQIKCTVEQLLAFCLQGGAAGATPQAQHRRRKLLAELAQQRAFCRAMLRRWHRSIALRRQLLALQDQPAPYTECLSGGRT